MTQPAKVQEPSMEEILASIRRIIADDEAKPADKPTGPAPAASTAKPAAADLSPSAAGQARIAPAAPTPAAAGNNQDDIDALLAGLAADPSRPESRPPLPDGDGFR